MWETGETIAQNYVLGDALGFGGMGIVYRARHVRTGRTVAVKRIRPELETDEYVRERFLHEGLAASRISHPCVVRVLDYGQTDAVCPYLVMGHVVGLPLGRLLARRTKVDHARAARMMIQLLTALSATHARGVVHADIKSDNVLVDAMHDDAVTLIDYGLARIDDCPRDADQRTVVSGTLDYLAPERLYGAPPTPESDVFGAGVILYELLTGRRPFRGKTTEELLACQLAGAPRSPSELCDSAEMSPALDQLVQRALAPDPRLRLSSAAMFQAALEAAFEVSTARLDDPAHAAVTDALRYGDLDGVIVAYLELAAALVVERRFTLASSELEHAVALVTGGVGETAARAPAALWRLLLVLAGVHDGAGDRSRALYYARQALAHATRARSTIGEARCRELLQRMLGARA